mmetsp:Transcript_35432/g.57149  ORF Transcript_35432/g.57149 Transcript_35432/m.57149 type:complete len:226 (+) Transcript_35432:506-1183(+)
MPGSAIASSFVEKTDGRLSALKRLGIGRVTNTISESDECFFTSCDILIHRRMSSRIFLSCVFLYDGHLWRASEGKSPVMGRMWRLSSQGILSDVSNLVKALSSSVSFLSSFVTVNSRTVQCFHDACSDNRYGIKSVRPPSSVSHQTSINLSEGGLGSFASVSVLLCSGGIHSLGKFAVITTPFPAPNECCIVRIYPILFPTVIFAHVGGNCDTTTFGRRFPIPHV